MLEDFRSRLWLTYRKDFASLGPSQLTSDVGWGCTIRSGQMLLAEAVARIALGRNWNRTANKLDDVQPVVQLFLDHPDAPLSIHNICAAGGPAGIVPGRWVGPWMLCKALDALFRQLGDKRPMGLRLHVACGSGGGAPELYKNSIRAQVAAAVTTEAGAAAASTQQGPQTTQQQHQESRHGGSGLGQDHSSCRTGCSGTASASSPSRGCCQEGEGQGLPAGKRHGVATEGRGSATGAAANPAVGPVTCDEEDPACTGSGRSSRPPGGGGGANSGQDGEESHGTEAVNGPTDGRKGAAAEAAGGGLGGGSGGGEGPSCGAASTKAEHPGQQQQQGASPPSSRHAPVLLLVPLTLGMEKLNPVYLPQLQQVLSWPHSVGIIGGRPSASLYLCGTQEAAFLYLDPHEAQPAVRPPLPPPAAAPCSGAPGGVAGAAAAPAAGEPHTAATAGGSTSSCCGGVGGSGGSSGATAATAGAAGSGAVLPAAALCSYFCEVVRLLPGSSLDPSMALGFLCTGPDDLEDLFTRLEALSRQHSAAPLMTLAEQEPEREEEEEEQGGRPEQQ
ncbi:hypothetical protein Agub_g6216, partial [Astrephomene gubernaculifera]